MFILLVLPDVKRTMIQEKSLEHYLSNILTFSDTFSLLLCFSFLLLLFIKSNTNPLPNCDITFKKTI